MKSQPFATNWRVVFSLFASCGIFALPAYAVPPDCSGSNLPTGPTAYVTAPSSNQVIVLDASTSPNTVACTIAVGTHPTNLAASPDGSQLFVENDTDASVSVIDLTSGAVTITVSLTTSGVTAPMTANLAVSPDGTSVYIISLPQTLVPEMTKPVLDIISLPSMTVSAATSFNTSASLVTGAGLGIAFSTDGATAYIATEGQTYVVTTSTNSIGSSSTVNGVTVVTDPAHSPSSFAYVVDVAGTVSEIAASPKTPLTVAGCTLANSSAITPDGSFDYYTCTSNDLVQKIAIGNTTLSSTAIPLASGAGPQGIAITSDGASAYVANNNGSVSVVSVSGNAATTPVTGLAALEGIGFRPVQLSIAPTSQSVPTGTKFQFISTPRFAFGAVAWSVSCTAGGAACGTVDSTGNYTAPPTIPSPNDVKVIATCAEIPLKSLKYPSQSVSAAVTVTPSQLVFTTQPPATGIQAGTPFGVVVKVEDESGNVDTSSGVSITITSAATPLTPIAAAVGGTTTVTAMNGVATFSNLILTQVGTTPLATTQYVYTLTATMTSAPPPTLTSATSTPFTIGPGNATQLVFNTQPASGATAGNALASVVIYVEDSIGNVVTTGAGSNSPINMTSAATPAIPPAAPVVGTITVPATGGVATFSNLILTQANIPPPSGTTTVIPYSYTMTASSTAPLLTTSPSNPFMILPAAAARLVFTTQPANGVAASALPAVNVVVEDTFNNVVTTGTGSNAQITISSIAAPAIPPAAPLGGTTTVPATGGVATFSNLILTQVGTTPLALPGSKYNYTLIAISTTPTLISPPSNPFTIAPGAATQLAFNTQPVSGTTAGNALASVVVYVEDITGLNVVTNGPGSNALITMIPASTPPGITTFSPVSANPVPAVGGVATFSNLILTQANIPPPSGSTTVTLYSYTMAAVSSSPPLASPPSNPFAISPAAATKLVYTTQPTNGTAAIALGAVDLAVEDTFGNVVTSGPGSNASITLISAASTTTACLAPGVLPSPPPPPAIAGATGGIATFSNLTFSLAGSYTLTAQSALPPSLLVSITSSSFTVAAGAAAQLVFKTEPVSGTAGIALAPVVVCVDDANNNVVTDPAAPASKAPITISSASAPPGAAGATGMTTVNAVAGVATFGNLVLSQVGTTPAATTKYGYTLTATSGALTPAGSTPAITLVAGPATKLVFAGSPAGSNAGLAVQNVSVSVEDASNNIVTDPAVAASTASITISSGSTPSGAASVGGTPTVAASGGVATFSNLILTQVGTTPLATTLYNYTLAARVSAPGALTGLAIATSSSFTITPAVAAQLAFAQPLISGVTPGGTPLASVAVYVEDAFSNVVASGAGSNASITMSPASTPSGIATFSLGSTASVSAVEGVATFSNLILTKANIPPPSASTSVTPYSYTLSAASAAPALTTSARSNSFTILPAAGTKLVVTTQPANGTAGLALGAVDVAVEDAFGNVATSGAGSNASVTIASAAVPASPAAAAVGGTTTVTATGGIATFSNLILTQVGTAPLAAIPYNYTLTAASGGLTGTTSSPAITIVPGAPAQLAFNTQPLSGTPAGSPLTPINVYVEDATGLNVVTSGTGSNASVTITSTAAPATPTAAPLGGTTTVSATSGVATFSNLILKQVGTDPLATTKYHYTLTASSGAVTSASSSSAITIVPGAATQLALATQPASGTAAGSALASLVVYVEDATGLNVVTSGAGSSALVTMTPASTPAGITTFSAGSASVSATGGVATFGNLILTQANIPPPSGSTTVTPYSYTMTASSTTPAFTTLPSNSFSISPAAASKLVFTTQPVNGTAGNPLAAVSVGVEDQFGNVATSNISGVTMAISAVMPAGQGGFTNDSTPSVAAAGGIATFANLKSTRSATLTLSASDGTLTGATSNSFVVVGNPAGVAPAGSPGSSQGNPLNISLTQNTVSANVDLMGPSPTDGVTFTVACAQPTPLNSSTPFAGVACAPSQSAPITTMGSATGNTQIPITINVVRTSSSATAKPEFPSTFGWRNELTQRTLFVLTIAIVLFALGGFRLTRMPGSRALYGFAFVLLLCASLAWMSACTQFSTPNVPAPPVSNAQSGPGSAVVTITPSGLGPGGDNFQTKTITIYFNVLNTP